MKSKFKGNCLLLLTAIIWGSAFVAQSAGMDFVGPFTFNSARSFLGFLILLPVIAFLSKAKNKSNPNEEEKSSFLPNRVTCLGGLCCGLALGIASSFQQVGLGMTTVGKAGFITALYVILVPLISVVFGKKIPKMIWFCVLLSIVGFYLLCINENITVGTGDLLILACAFCFSCHILVIDYFTAKGANGVQMACLQFLVAGLVTLPPAILFETTSVSSLLDAWLPICYAGIMSSGVAYTLQIVGQKYTDPTTATLIMSLESVFCALSGWLLLDESMSPKELCGCALVFCAVILAQIPLPLRKKTNQ